MLSSQEYVFKIGDKVKFCDGFVWFGGVITAVFDVMAIVKVVGYAPMTVPYDRLELDN